MYAIAREITDEVLGKGAYAEVNQGNPDPSAQREVERSKEGYIK